jgi:hypothetical protein
MFGGGGGGGHYDFVIFLKNKLGNFHFSNVNLTKFVNFFQYQKIEKKKNLPLGSWDG